MQRFIPFLILASIGALIAVASMWAMDYGAKRVAYEMNGGSSIVYIRPDLNARQPDGTYPLIIANTGANIPNVAWYAYEYGAQDDIYGEAYRKSPLQRLNGNAAPFPPTGLAMYKGEDAAGFQGMQSLPPGVYGIDFSGSNGSWRETLTIAEYPEGIRAAVSVQRDGHYVFMQTYKPDAPKASAPGPASAE